MSKPLAKRRRVSRTLRLGDVTPDVLECLSRWCLDTAQITAGVLRNIVGHSLRNVCLRQLNHNHWRYMRRLANYEVEVRCLAGQVLTLRCEGSFEDTAAFYGNAIKSATFDAQLYIDVDRPLPPFLLKDVFPTVDIQEKVAISFSYGSVFPSFSDIKAVVSAFSKVPALKLDGEDMRRFLNDTMLVDLKDAGVHHLCVEERGYAAFDSVAMYTNAIIQFLSGVEDCTLHLEPISVDKGVVKDLLKACEEGSLAETFRFTFCPSDIAPEEMTAIEGIKRERSIVFTVAGRHMKFMCNGELFEVYRGTHFNAR